MEFEEALDVLGRKIGRFHYVNLSLISLVYVFQAFFFMSYVFTTLRSEHRCLVPECDVDEMEMRPDWLAAAVPVVDGVPHPCLRFVPTAESQACSPEAFSNETQECDQWVYPNKELSIMTEWDLTSCSTDHAWKLTLVGTANNVGRMLGLPVAGFLSDRFGRKTILVSLLAVSGVIGIVRSVAPSYLFYVVFEFIDPIFYDGTGGTALVMGMEILPPRARGAWSVATHVVFALALAALASIAWLVPYWRWLLRVLYSAALLSLPLLWLYLQESTRWLVSKGRKVAAQNAIQRAAKMNGSAIDFTKVELAGSRPMHQGGEGQGEVPEEERISITKELAALLRSRVLSLRLANCCFAWVVILFIYEGLSINSVGLAGNSYLNFILVVLIEIPGAFITAKLVEVFGRRTSLSGSFFLTALCCIVCYFVPADMPWLRTSVVMLAKLFITISFTVIYLLSTELFPTSLRATMYAACATMGRLGSVVAPQTPLLRHYQDMLPMLVFGAAAFTTGLSALAFPDMGDERLPATVAEAEAVGALRRKAASLPEAPPTPIPETFSTHL